MQAGRSKGAARPEDLHLLFADAFNGGDLERLTALYEPDAVFAPEPGRTVRGREAIREAYAGFLALRPRIDIQTLSVFAHDDGLALMQGRWSIAGTGPDGSPVHRTGRDAELVRRQPDGSWLFAIDNPFSPE